MSRSKKLVLLLAVLVIVCIAAFAALRMEQRQEQISVSGETVFSIDPDAVTALAWSTEDVDLAFHRDGDSWIYDGDEAFPVDGDAIRQLLEQFQSFGAAFTIEEVEDYGQYGLEDPVCTIDLTADEESWQILLGDYSAMDSQRYVSIGDGRVYLAASDPMDAFDVELRELIANDEVPDLDGAASVTFAGAADYSLYRKEDSGASWSDEDVYFTQLDGADSPLDTQRVEDYLECLSGLELTDYVTYNATGEELSDCGLDDPELTVTVEYKPEGEEDAVSFQLSVSRDPEQRGQTQAEEEEDAGEITAYVRVGQSPILYQISGEDYQSLMAASYDDLRHQEIFYGAFEDITQIDVSLDGAKYVILSEGDGDDRVWFYQEEEQDITDLQSALEGLTAEEFTDETPEQAEEITLTLHLDSQQFPQATIILYRYDGSSCLAVVDGTPVALVSRSAAVDLMESVRAIVLN